MGVCGSVSDSRESGSFASRCELRAAVTGKMGRELNLVCEESNFDVKLGLVPETYVRRSWPRAPWNRISFEVSHIIIF